MTGTIEAPNPARQVRRVTWVGLFANLFLAGIKFAGGLLGASQAVVADAVHSLSDMSTDIVILLGVRYWSRPADADHPHGHHRVETVVTLSIGLALAGVASGVLWNAITTVRQAHAVPPGWIAFATCLLSIASKEGLYRWTVRIGTQIRSGALIANAWHHRSDALSSLPAAIAVAAAAVDPDWIFLDHIGAMAVSLFIYQAAAKIVFPAFSKLIDAGAPEETLSEITALALATPGVDHVHGLRTRYVNSMNLAVDLHVQVESTLSVRSGHAISEAVKTRLLQQGPDIIDVVVHLEPFDPGQTDEDRDTLALRRRS